MDSAQRTKIGTGQGFFAALDQSGGSTPNALAEYGIAPDRYTTEAQMFDLVHEMRTRVITDAAFDGSTVLATILFEQTMQRDIDGKPAGRYLWEDKQIVPILKVDQGLADEADAVQLMKPMDRLDDLLARATQHEMFGTKMRSVIKDDNPGGIDAVVAQQFEYAERIAAAGLVPILEPEVSIASPHKSEAESMLHDALHDHLDRLPDDALVMLKLTIPSEVGRYADLGADRRVLRVLALSGGYSRDEACERLRRDSSMIASFSRALLQGLTADQTDEQFSATLAASVAEIDAASQHRSVPAAG